MLKLSLKEFNLIRQFAKEKAGISLGDEKSSLVYSRLNSVVRELNLNSFYEYYEYLVKDKTGDALEIFINRITTNHTFFMREPAHFNYLNKNVFTYLKDKYKASKDIRIWCAGCSTGEEAYTLQILLQEFFRDSYDTDILATDISTKVLKKAYQGIYTNEKIKTLPDEWIKKYFKKYDDNNYIVKDLLKNHIIFRYLNLISDKYPLKKKVQVIFCRNVMIYFDNKTREEVIKKFYDYTEEGGYLFIGHSESLGTVKTNYEYVMPAVYRKV